MIHNLIFALVWKDCQGVALANLGLDIYYIVQHARVAHPYIKIIHRSS